MELKRAKGTRDFSFEEQLLRQEIIDTLVKVFEMYGYAPISTPILETYDVLSSKYSGGEEILKETFKLKDQGGRELGLRYDLTVPLARYVAMNPQLKMPIKTYRVGSVFRDGPIKLGRYREFLQCDVDCVGVKGMEADAEMLCVAKRVFRSLKLDVVLKVNNRKILDAVMDKAGVSENKRESIILSVDKLDKFGMDAVLEELREKKVPDKTVREMFELLMVKGRNKEKIDFLRKKLGNCEGLDEIEKVLNYVKDVEFDVSLARGLNYYTGTVFEVFLADERIKSSLAAGGRYDKMINSFVGKEGYEAVGISFGVDVISDALKDRCGKKSVCQLYIIPINTFDKSWEIAEELRKNGVFCDVDLVGKGISKNLDYACKMGIKYVLFVGKKELDIKKVKLRNMESGKEELLDLKDVVNRVCDEKS